MAKVVVAGDAVVVTSDFKFEDLETIAKYRPEALVLMGGEDNKEKVFVVSVNKRGVGDINKYGATFNSESHDEAKRATITFVVDWADGNDIKERVADAFGSAITNLNALEQTLPQILEEIAKEKEAIKESISIIQ